MALGATQKLNNGSNTPTYAEPLATEEITWPAANVSFILLHVKNASGTACVVTITSHATAGEGLAQADLEVTVPITTGDRVIRIATAYRALNAVEVAFSTQANVLAGVFYT